MVDSSWPWFCPRRVPSDSGIFSPTDHTHLLCSPRSRKPVHFSFDVLFLLFEVEERRRTEKIQVVMKGFQIGDVFSLSFHQTLSFRLVSPVRGLYISTGPFPTPVSRLPFVRSFLVVSNRLPFLIRNPPLTFLVIII